MSIIYTSRLKTHFHSISLKKYGQIIKCEWIHRHIYGSILSSIYRERERKHHGILLEIYTHTYESFSAFALIYIYVHNNWYYWSFFCLFV